MANGFAAGGQLTTTTDGESSLTCRSLFSEKTFYSHLCKIANLFIYFFTQSKTFPVSPLASLDQSSWTSFAHSRSVSARTSSRRPCPRSTSLPVRSDIGVRDGNLRSRRRLMPLSSPRVLALGDSHCPARRRIGRAGSAPAPFVMVPFRFSGECGRLLFFLWL
jgi:hypothetical protein